MKTFSGGRTRFSTSISILLSGLLLSVGSVYASTIVVGPNTVIDHSTTYDDVTLDMTHGSFIIKNKAVLAIKNSTVKGTLSPDNPNLINIDDGGIDLKGNKFSITTENIIPHPKTQSLQHVIQVALGNVKMDGNRFSIDNLFSAGLLITTSSIATSDFKITNNAFERFHGVLYLIASDKALIADNIFSRNSYGNLVNIGNNSNIIGNTIYYAGNNHLGNAMDIIDSDNIRIQQNTILTPTCHGIYVLNSHNLIVDSNKITGGITYAMNVYTYPEKVKSEKYVSDLVKSLKLKHFLSSNITVTNNYMSQNRFGLAASDVDGLVVRNNYFIQRFMDSEARKFWTDNTILMNHVTHLTWTGNFYKEAFTQQTPGNNSQSMQIVAFPAMGGVVL